MVRFIKSSPMTLHWCHVARLSFDSLDGICDGYGEHVICTASRLGVLFHSNRERQQLPISCRAHDVMRLLQWVGKSGYLREKVPLFDHGMESMRMLK